MRFLIEIDGQAGLDKIELLESLLRNMMEQLRIEGRVRYSTTLTPITATAPTASEKPELQRRIEIRRIEGEIQQRQNQLADASDTMAKSKVFCTYCGNEIPRIQGETAKQRAQRRRCQSCIEQKQPQSDTTKHCRNCGEAFQREECGCEGSHAARCKNSWTASILCPNCTGNESSGLRHELQELYDNDPEIQGLRRALKVFRSIR